jgi:hypothetical protein
MDVHDIVDDIYRHAENFMHESGTVMQPDYVSKPEDLYLWCLIGSRRRAGSTCVRCVTLADATQAYGLQRQSRQLSLKRLECMIDTATSGARCTLASPRLE